MKEVFFYVCMYVCIYAKGMQDMLIGLCVSDMQLIEVKAFHSFIHIPMHK